MHHLEAMRAGKTNITSIDSTRSGVICRFRRSELPLEVLPLNEHRFASREALTIALRKANRNKGPNQRKLHFKTRSEICQLDSIRKRWIWTCEGLRESQVADIMNKVFQMRSLTKRGCEVVEVERARLLFLAVVNAV